MKTPTKVSLAHAVLAVDHFLDRETITGEQRGIIHGPQRHGTFCRTCARPIDTVVAYMTIHDTRFEPECAGSGRVIKMLIPFCPECEERPDERGCVHVRPFGSEARLA